MSFCGNKLLHWLKFRSRSLTIRLRYLAAQETKGANICAKCLLGLPRQPEISAILDRLRGQNCDVAISQKANAYLGKGCHGC